MSKLYDHSAGKWVDVNDADVDSLVQSGKYTFESGIDIPVVAPDGALTSIKSDDAFNAFKEGYRWQNQRDRDADYDVQQQRIKQKAFDDDSTAFGLGLLRGATMGGSDVAINALDRAGLSGIKEAAANVKEVNPVASGIGSAVGTIGSIVAGNTAAGIVGQGGARALKAGEGAAEALTAGLGASRAAKAVQTASSAALGSAAEGAYYGLGEGISEAALGDPHDVVNNLAAGVSLGALMGGGFGAALGGGKVAAPFLKSAFDSSADALSSVVSKAAMGAEKRFVKAALTKQGEETLAKEFADLANTPAYSDIRDLFMSGEYKAAKDYASQVRARQTEFVNEQKDLRKGLTDYFKTATDSEQTAMKEALEDAGNDAFQAAGDIYKKIQQQSNDFRNSVVQFAEEAAPERLAKTSAQIDEVVNRLKGVDTAEAKQWAGDLLDYNYRNFRRQGVTEAEEFTALDNLKRNVLPYEQISQIRDGRIRKELTDLWKYSKAELTAPESTIREEIKAFSRNLDSDYTAYNALKDLLGKKTVKSSALGKLAADPAKLDAIDPLINSYPEFAPMLDKLKRTASNTQARNSILQDIRAKISDMKMESVNGRLTTDDLYQIIKDGGFIRGNPMAKAERMQELSRYLKGAEGRSPLDSAAYMDRLLNGGPSKLEKFLPFEKQLEKLDAVHAVKGQTPSWVATNGPAAGAAAGFALGGPVGAKIGGALGSAAGARSALKTASPYAIMQGISKIERQVNTGLNKIQSAAKGAVDALTSSTFQRVGTATNVHRTTPEQFRQQSENIKKMANPQAMMDALADMPGSNVPQIQTALATKLSAAASYLNAMMPEDPLAASALFPNKSAWIPSELELSKFQRRVQVVNDPTTAIHAIAAGTVTPEQVDALKNVYPEIFQGLQEQIVDGMMAAKDPPSYKSKLILAQVFGVPADYSMRPDFVKAMQSTFIPVDQGGRPVGSADAQPRGKPQQEIELKPMDTVATATDNITFKGQVR